MILPAVALLALTLLRLVIAASTPLSPDEAYYWIWSRALAGGFYDHPPMVALWIRVGTYFCGDTALGVRLLAPLSTALASVALAHAGTILTGDRARGIMASVLLNATLAFGVGAISMTPDTPLLFFWILALTALARFIAHRQGGWLLAAGVCTGLAMTSKYSTVFLGASVALWLLLVPSLRGWLTRPWPWLAGLSALAVFAPVILWNAQHDWVGFLKQGGRLGGFHPGRAGQYLLDFLGGQIGMLTPLIFVLCCAGIVVALRQTWKLRHFATILLLLLSLLPLPLMLLHTLTDRVQANWPAILYPSAMLLAVAVWPRLHRPAAMLGFALILPVYLQAAWPVLPIPAKLDPSMKRLAGWPEFAARLEAERRRQGATFIAADNYALAAMLTWHLPSNTLVIGDHSRWSTFNLPRPDLQDQAGLLVRSARLSDRFDPAPWTELGDPFPALRDRAGVVAEEYRVYKVTGPAANPELAILPHPR